MPLYEYACTSCGRHFDVQQSFSDPPLQTCEECGGALKRVFHPVGIVLKGSGFYATDNRGKKTPAADKATTSSSSSSSPSSSSESKSESKSGSKPESKPAEKKKDAPAS